MIDVLMIITIVLCVALIVLVTLQPRQSQIFSIDATSNIRKPSYWQSNTGIKVATLVVSIALFILLFIFLYLTFAG